MEKSLLIISCSGSKDHKSGRMPAIDRYTGVYYKIIKKLKREKKFPDSVELLIISAKYGLLFPQEPIEFYDRKMDKARAEELHDSVVLKLSEHLHDCFYEEILVNLGKDYLLSIDGFQRYLPPKTKLTFVSGRIGERMRAMKEWLIDKYCDTRELRSECIEKLIELQKEPTIRIYDFGKQFGLD